MGSHEINLDIRCKSCGKLLLKDRDLDLEIKCNRCGEVSVVFHHESDLFVVTDHEGRIRFINGRVEEVTGYTADECVGKTPAIWGGQMPTDFYRDMWKTIKEEKRTFSALVRNRKKDGTIYYCRLVVSPVLQADGNIGFFIGTENLMIN